MIVMESDFAGVAYPLDCPRIGAAPYAGTVTASTSAAGFSAALAATSQTYEGWKPTSLPAWWQIAFTSAPVSYVGIAAHRLGTVGATVAVQRWDGAAWVNILSHTPTDDSPIFVLLKRRTLDRLRLAITGTTAPFVGVVYVGDVTEFPRRSAYVGASDLSDMVRDEYRTTNSDGGQWIDRIVERKSQPVSLRVEHISEAWKAAYLDGLIADMKARPVFVADKPGKFAKSVAFAYTTGPVVPERIVANAEVGIAVSFEMVGHVA